MIDDEINYGSLKQHAKENGQRVNDLIVLAPQNDPFYAGTPGDWEMARWFEGLWNAFYQGQNMHIRRVHYQIISQDPPVVLPNGLSWVWKGGGRVCGIGGCIQTIGTSWPGSVKSVQGGAVSIAGWCMERR